MVTRVQDEKWASAVDSQLTWSHQARDVSIRHVVLASGTWC